jgi:hypothetical protein
VAPQSGANDQFYCIVDYIALNKNCEAQRVSKNEDRFRSQKECMGNLSLNVSLLKKKIIV